MKANVVIIGSGVAATAIAHKLLSIHPAINITILEAGSKIKLKDFGLFQNYLIEGKLPFDNEFIYDSRADRPYPIKDRKGENDSYGGQEILLAGSRLFAYGGSTTHWGGWSFRLKEEDFKLKSSRSEPWIINWPVDYSELEPFYDQAEEFIGVSGSRSDIGQPPAKSPYPYAAFPYTKEDGIIIRGFKANGISYGHLPIARYGVSKKISNRPPCQATGTCKYCPFGSRFCAANILDEMIEDSKFSNLKIIENAVVTKINKGKQNTVTGVTYVNTLNNTEQNVLSDFVIVAAGAIESTKLLLESEIGNEKSLGKYFVTHPFFSYSATIEKADDLYQPQMGFPTLVSRHFDNLQEQAKGKFILLHPSSSPSVRIADYMCEGKPMEQVVGNMRSNIAFSIDGMVEVFGKPSFEIKRLRDKNRFGLHQTQINYQADSDFNDRMKDISDVVGKVFTSIGATGMRQQRINWRADHAASTTRMSEYPEDGVVDRNLRVHNYHNVYICSNSTFPNIGAVNPTLTLTALAIRLGQHLSKLL